jgi:hypothetical protein
MSDPTVHDPTPAAPPRRRLRRAAVVAAAFVAVVVGCWVYLSFVWDRELREAIAEADRSDPDWRLLDIEAKRPVIPDEENSSLQMAKMKQATPARWPFWYYQASPPGGEITLADYEDFNRRLDDRPPPVLLDAEQERVLRFEMKRAAAAMDEARKLIDFPRGRHPITWRKDYFSSGIDPSQRSRGVADLLRHDVTLRCQDGDLKGALDSTRASFNVSLCLRDEPLLISQLIRVAIRKVTLGDLERILAQGEPPEEALAEFQRRLEEDEKDNLFLVGVRGERGLLDGFLEVIQRRDMTHAEMRQAIAGMSDGSAGASWMGKDLDVIALYGTARHERAQMLARMNRVVEIAQLPPEEQGREVDAWVAAAKKGPPLVRRLTPAVQKVNLATRRSHAEMRCMVVLLALERFRQKHDRWPDRLEELTPDYLKAVPLDPFDAKPIKYARRGDGVTVYTVGPDGEDNGGNLNGKWLDKGSDWGFRLWDANKRRQPPPK